ncbi:MAG: PhoU domain-containing protein, partial [Bacteroidota bacterium]
MGEKAQLMISKVLDSFIFSNAVLAHETLKMREDMNNLYAVNFEIITGLLLQNQKQCKTCCYLLDVNRNLQFISTQAVSIAHEVIFLIEAKIIKHQTIELSEDDRHYLAEESEQTKTEENS